MTLLARFCAIALGAMMVVALVPSGARAQDQMPLAYSQAVAQGVAGRAGMAEFYRERDFAPFWTAQTPEGQARRAALFAAVARAEDHGLPASAYGASQLMAQMRAVRTAAQLGGVEVALAKMFLDYSEDVSSGLLEPQSVVDGIEREAPRPDALALLTQVQDGTADYVLRSLPPQTPEYARLMKAKLRLERAMRAGGWGEDVPVSKLEPGDSGPRVAALRNRLVRMGYLARGLSAEYDAPLRAAVIRFQEDHGLTADGVAGDSTLEALNTPVHERLQSVIVAMERERWLNLPDGLGARHILVNLTDFHARIIDDGKVTFETRSVVGHRDPDRRTPEFSDVMDHMVINPSWYVPRSIIVNEYLPQLKKNPGAVSHIEITDRRGRQVSREQGFADYTAASFPYAMRQPPGPGNALGQVKFMFPNHHNIYLHDTPAKSLFSREVRAYSHGCVRLNDPKDFAYALLARQSNDPVAEFQRHLRTGRETRVNLEQPVPVHLIYRTAFTTAKGNVQFRRDIYGRDARVWQALSSAGVALPGLQG